MTERPTSTCHEPEVGDLIGRYEHGLLTGEEKRRFEAHLLECDHCFAELERGAEVASAMRAHAPALRHALQPQPAARVSGAERGTRGTSAPGAGHGWSALARGARRFWRGPVWVPAAVAALLLLFLLNAPWRTPDPEDLVRYPTQVAAEDLMRAGDRPGALAELLAAGGGHLNAGDYGAAVRFLRAARDRAPEDARAAAWLGLALALGGRPEDALGHLEAAAAAPDTARPAQALWTLAHCYLDLGRTDDAHAVLMRIRDEEDPYAHEAARLLARLR